MGKPLHNSNGANGGTAVEMLKSLSLYRDFSVLKDFPTLQPYGRIETLKTRFPTFQHARPRIGVVSQPDIG